jgi:hypothetical protein
MFRYLEPRLDIEVECQMLFGWSKRIERVFLSLISGYTITDKLCRRARRWNSTASTPVPTEVHKEKREMRGEGEREPPGGSMGVRRRHAQPEKEEGKSAQQLRRRRPLRFPVSDAVERGRDEILSSGAFV